MATVDPVWIAAAQASEKTTLIPASITLAQFILESGWGQHIPPGSNNPFGIKALPGEPSVPVVTHEFIAGRYVQLTAQFAAFPSLAAAFTAHAALLANGAPYVHARSLLPSVTGFCNALTGVYATDPNYGATLIEIIQDNDLTRYDEV
jgi:flagellum-specific peptidoglycan hydrolase FlgJ